jgi:hypothetical protein
MINYSISGKCSKYFRVHCQNQERKIKFHLIQNSKNALKNSECFIIYFICCLFLKYYYIHCFCYNLFFFSFFWMCFFRPFSLDSLISFIPFLFIKLMNGLTLFYIQMNSITEIRIAAFDRTFRMDSYLIKGDRIFIRYFKIMNHIFCIHRKGSRFYFNFINIWFPQTANPPIFSLHFVQNCIGLGRGPGLTRIFVRKFWISCSVH